MKRGFDNKKYLDLQTKEILNRISKVKGSKLYIEFGGKLFDDVHASRVLPGFDKNAKIEVLKKLSSQLEVLFVISAKDIEKNKIRSDLGITYEMDTLRQMDKLTDMGIMANKIVITQYEGEKKADMFKNKLERRGIRAYIHTFTKGYPKDVDIMVSDEGYGKNSYIEVEKSIIVVTASGAGSGKLATCLSQIYHEYKKGIDATYAKYETFPIWNLPLKHPVNMAYEAATANLKDINVIDSFHLEKYGIPAVNYNRDMAVFPILKSILKKITNKDIYSSPTDMGVNMNGFAITNEEVVIEASKQEIIRRYYYSLCDYKKGLEDNSVSDRISFLMSELNIDASMRKVVKASLDKSKEKKEIAVAIELPGGKIITGRNTALMSAPATAVIKTLKSLSKINESIFLLAPIVLEPMQEVKKTINMNEQLNLYDIITALSISASTNPFVKNALEKLSSLSGLKAHASHILSNDDYQTLKKLNIDITEEPVYFSKNLYDE